MKTPRTARRFRVLVLLGILLLMPWEVSAGTNRWTTEGPFGGVVHELARDAIDPAVLYAATETAGVWKSVDGARSWFPINSGLDRVARRVVSLEAHPTVSGTLFLSTADHLRRSTDGGSTWTRLGSQLPSVGELAIAPSNGDVLYYGSGFEGLFKSLDGGLSWSVTGFTVDGFFWDIEVDPNDEDTVFAHLGSEGLYKTTDGGATWQRSDEGFGTPFSTYSGNLAIDPRDSNHLYGVDGSRVYRSVDGGAHWSPAAPFSFGIESVAFDPRFPGRVYLGGNFDPNVLWSDDGEQWFSSTLDKSFVTITDFAFGPDGTSVLYLTDRRGDGVYRSEDSITWEVANQGMTASTVWDFAPDPSGPRTYAAAFNGIHRRENPGAPWELLEGSREHGDCCRLIRLDPSQPQVLYTASVVGGVLRSLDGGDTWEPANYGRSGSLAVYDLALDPSDPSTLYLAEYDGVYRSDDRAGSWRKLSAGFIMEPVFHVQVDPRTPTTIYAGTRQQIFKSLDAGASWNGLPNPGGSLQDFAIDPNDPDTLYALDFNTLDISRDGGASWTQLAAEGLPVTLSYSMVIDPVDGGLLVGTFEDLWHSTDGGASFEIFEGGIGRGASVLGIAIDDGPVRTIYAGLDESAAISLTRGCIGSEKVLCLDDRTGDQRFAVSIHYDTDLGGGFEGDAAATSLAPIGIADGGILSFFQPSNPEALVKLINGCGFNDRYWVFAAATTSVGFELKVEDTLARETRIYTNPDDTPAATITDTEAFATCDASAAEPGEDHGASAEPHGDPGPRTRVTEAQRPIVATPAKATHGEGCVSDANTLCIDDQPGDRRFAVRLHFDSVLGGGKEGDAMATSLAPLGITDGGILSFFQLSLPEVLVKVIDGCGFNGSYWVFYAATTNLGFEMTVEDTRTGTVRTYTNPDGVPAETVTDVEAFATCGAQS